jgi:hypothetical protein
MSNFTDKQLSNLYKMTLKQAIKILKNHNKWRRGCEITPMANPTELGIAIDIIIKYLENATKN